TTQIFEDRLALLEGAEVCRATASGMSAVHVALTGLLRAGDHLVAGRALFGSCRWIISEWLPRFGVETSYVDATDLDAWKAAVRPNTKAFLVESPANPLLEVTDIGAVAQVAHAAGAKLVVDNVFATPLLQRPLELGADIVVYSSTKHIDGQGRVLGGAILGPEEYIDEKVQLLMRHTGPSMSPFNAWVLLKGLETLRLRLDRQCDVALRVAEWLERHPRVRSVRYPFLPSHPQYDLARRQMSGGGSVVTFELDCPPEAGKERAFAVLDRLRVADISNNLGDAKSLVTHPATTTHRRLTPEARAAAGITDAVIRLSVGLEDPDDLLADLDQALCG